MLLVEKFLPHLPKKGVVVQWVLHGNPDGMRAIPYKEYQVHKDALTGQKQSSALGRATICTKSANDLADMILQSLVAVWGDIGSLLEWCAKSGDELIKS